jgi:ParB/RepB/Spo0J family partition protein
MKEIEIKAINRKYESFRLKDGNREKYLLDSIREKGIQEPLQCGQDNKGNYILLDGYKRLRCSCRLRIPTVPVVDVGLNEADSILSLIRLSNSRTLNTLEQAVFVNELRKGFGLTVSEIAKRLECSLAWVSVRLGIFGQMSDLIRQEVFAGRFPVRSYMYTLRQFTRVNKTNPLEVDKFVKAVSGKGLSLRQIETLAYGYFRGGNALKKQIEEGELGWTLKRLKSSDESLYSSSPDFTEEESRFIRDLELFQKYMHRLRVGFGRFQGKSECFEKTVRLLADGILSVLDMFGKELEGVL